MSTLRKSTVSLFINSIAKVMISDFDRVTISDDWIRDLKTGVSISIPGNNCAWRMYVPDVPNASSSRGPGGIFLLEDHKNTLKDAMRERENIELILVHTKLYEGDNSYVSFSAIQEMRKEKPMVEEAWQNLLTIYALNMDPER